MPSFGLICEGHTDQIVLESILYGFFDEEPDVRPLVPLRDETDQSQLEYGGWYQVLEYCRSQKLKNSLQFIDFLIIQIDTDVSEEKHFDISHTDEQNQELSVTELVEQVRQKLSGLIGSEFYTAHQDRLIFAVAVHSTECWLLPLYTDKKKAAKTKNCLGTLNRAIFAKYEFSIDPNSKNSDYYKELSKPFEKSKKSQLTKLYALSESLQIFVESLALQTLSPNQPQDEKT